MNNGTVQHLYVKQKRKNLMLASSEIYLQQEHGIEGDVNYDRASPRQVLITSSKDLKDLSIAPGELRENIVLGEINSNHFKPGAKLTFSSGAKIRALLNKQWIKQEQGI